MRCTEYEFVCSDGSKRYEIVDPEAGTPVMGQINALMRMHGAIVARPLQERGTIGSGRTFCNSSQSSN